jgi:cytochrome c oxidase subunit 2
MKNEKLKIKNEKLWRQPVLIFAFCIFNFAFLSGCRGSQSALNPAGPQSGSIGRMWWLMFYTCSAVFIIVGVIVLMAIFRKRQERKKAGDTPDTSPDAKREQRLSRVVVAGIGLTVVILFVFLISDFSTGRSLFSSPDPQAMSIKITGHQWWWEVEYEDSTASNIVHTANEIHIPVGRTVKFKLFADDVIHSFWVPNLHGKKDLIPGHEVDIWFRADRAGEYRGQCAEFCGYQHAHMAFTVVAEPPEQFDAWINQQRASSVPPTNEAEQRGQQVFLSSPCIMCHSIRGTDAGGKVAPELTHLASRRTIAAATLPNTRDHLAEWITNSQEIKPGNHMPPVPLSPDELQSLVTYLESLK